MADEQKYRNVFGEWAKAVQSRVQFEYECSRSVIDLGVLLGTIREAVIRNILKEFLPASLEIGTGQIVDWQGTSSKQIDIVIARNSVPTFRFMGGCSAFLLESVLATVEVKSMLYEDKLVESLNNSKSIRDLEFMVHLKAKGPKLFDEAFEWVQKQGGLSEVFKRIKNPQTNDPIACPDDVWKVLTYVTAWLHWESGDFRNRKFWEENFEMFDDAEFDFFSHLLTHTLGEKDVNEVLVQKWEKAGSIKKEFFAQLPWFGWLMVAEGVILLVHGLRLGIGPFPFYGDLSASIFGGVGIIYFSRATKM